MAVVEELIGRLTLQTRGINEAKKATQAVEAFRRALQGLAGVARIKLDGPAKMARGFRDIQREAAKAAAAQKKLANGGGFARVDGEAKKHLSTLERLRRAYQDTARAAAQLHRRPSSGGSWLEGEIRALRRYQAIQREVSREAGRLGVPRHRAERMSRLPYEGRYPYGEAVVGREVGSAVVRGSRYAVAQGANTLQETNRQTNAGMEAGQIAQLDKAAISLSAQFPSVDATTIRTLGRDARNMFPNFEAAMQALPDIVKARVMMQAAKGVEGADNDLQDFMKSEDIIGKTEDPGQFKRDLDSYVKATQVEGRQLPGREFKQFAKMSKAGGVSLGEEFRGAIAPTFYQSEGGARFGTQIAAGMSSLISNRRTKKSTAALNELGLLDKKGNLKDAAKYQDNPYQYAIENMMPALAKKGVNVNDDKAIGAYMARIFSNSMTENMFTKLITQRDQVERNIKMYRGAKGLDSAKDQTRGDPYVGLEGLIAQVRNFFGVTQGSNIDFVTKRLAAFTEAFGDANKSLAGSPNAAQAIGVTTAAGAAGLGALSVKLISGFVRRALGLGGKVGAGAGSTATGAAVAEGAAATGAGAATTAGSAAAGAAGLATAGVVGTAIGTAAGAAFAAYATAEQLPKVAAKEGPGAIDPATGEKIETAIPKTTPWLRNAIVSLFGGKVELNGSEDAETKAMFAREASRARAMASRSPAAPVAGTTKPVSPTTAPKLSDAVQKSAEGEKARLTEIQAAAQKVIDTLNSQTTIRVDSSQIDAAQGKADKLKATIAGLGSAAAAAGRGISGSTLQTGSNTFSTGATSP